jgi:hypothetical protein
MSLIKDLDPTQKTILDIASVGTAVATVTNLLPALAALVTIVWTGIRIYETDTVQRFLGRKKTDEKPGSE